MSNIIAKEFDKIMSDIANNVQYTTSLKDLKDNNIKNNKIIKSKPKPKPKLKPKKILIIKNPLYNIIKKAIFGSIIYIILSLPCVINIINFHLFGKVNQYKNIILRSIIFSITLVLFIEKN